MSSSLYLFKSSLYGKSPRKPFFFFFSHRGPQLFSFGHNSTPIVFPHPLICALEWHVLIKQCTHPINLLYVELGFDDTCKSPVFSPTWRFLSTPPPPPRRLLIFLSFPAKRKSRLCFVRSPNKAGMQTGGEC